jgi:hypothetical protein
MLTQLWRSPFPGLRPAVVAFAGFLVVEYAWTNMTKKEYGPRKPTIHKFKTGKVDEMPTKEHWRLDNPFWAFRM